MPDPNQSLGSTPKPFGDTKPTTNVPPVVVEEKPPIGSMPPPLASTPMVGNVPPPPPPTKLGTIPPPPPSVIGGLKPKKKIEKSVLEPALDKKDKKLDKKVEPTIFPPGGKPKKKKGKIIATILVLLVLVVGGVSATILVRQQQDIREEASTKKSDGTCLAPGEGKSDCTSGKSFFDITCPITEERCGTLCTSAGNCLAPGDKCCGNKDYFARNCAVTETRCGTKPTTGKSNGTCLAPGEGKSDCRSGKSYFDTTCPVTEERCGTRPSLYCSSDKEEECEAAGQECIYTRYGGYCIEIKCRDTGCLRPGEQCCHGDGDFVSADICPVTETKCVVGTSGGDNGDDGGDNGGNGDTTLTCQCIEIKAFDAEDAELTAEDLTNLAVGDEIKFAVRGSASTGAITKARFTINGTLRTEVTGKQTINTVSYYVDTYTIPEGVTSFTIKAELYHPTALWF